jgi:hypothetical protein
MSETARHPHPAQPEIERPWIDDAKPVGTFSLLQVTLALYAAWWVAVGLTLGMLGMFVWPYPFLLCQRVIDPGHWLGGALNGALATGVVAWLAQELFHLEEDRVSKRVPTALLILVGTLGTATLLAYLYARAQGWPIGE